ncbi:4-aminobutyrate transaminase [Jaminaea rosea]|uniref:4-aminobutyrate aminotransferase n=1 Tax=Jaminaea rosea TaxID=1569628 RepID=A0A316UXH1_9BASI|nr:4-aminobutyrate transaminase [Jaminaea rosea]PWN28623.1 4-aminobutyrate transaminase [Jaminaea rosea]
MPRPTAPLRISASTSTRAIHPALTAGQPLRPRVTTSNVPGPRSQSILQDLNRSGDFRTSLVAVDYAKSKGNYLTDADGNQHLDCFGQIASISVGYRNEQLEALAGSERFRIAAMNRPAIGVFPPHDWREILEAGLMKDSVRPRGLTQIFTANCGSTAIESAYKAAFMAYQHKQRGHSDFTAAENDSSLFNSSPGSPSLSILSFKTGFHGRLFGSLSTTRSKALHKVDIPAFDWPAVDWPQLRYPLEENEADNRKEEERCIALVEETIERWQAKSPVAAVVVEPIQSEGGDNHASPFFFQRLREVTRQRGVYLIVDEVQTGVAATGTFWAHEKWNLPHPPDAVTFSKKMQAAGYYHTEELRPSAGYRNFNTWMGDPARAMQASEIVKIIEENGLVEHTAQVGAQLYEALRGLSARHPGLIQNLRGKGQGTFLAFDCETPAQRDELVGRMRNKGVLVGGSGARAVRLRPLLIFSEKELEVFVETLQAVATEIVA